MAETQQHDANIAAQLMGERLGIPIEDDEVKQWYTVDILKTLVSEGRTVDAREVMWGIPFDVDSPGAGPIASYVAALTRERFAEAAALQAANPDKVTPVPQVGETENDRKRQVANHVLKLLGKQYQVDFIYEPYLPAESEETE